MAIQDKRGKRFIEDYRKYDLEERELYRKLPTCTSGGINYIGRNNGIPQCGP